MTAYALNPAPVQETELLQKIRAGRIAALEGLSRLHRADDTIVRLYDGRSARQSRPVFRSHRALARDTSTVLILTNPVAA